MCRRTARYIGFGVAVDGFTGSCSDRASWCADLLRTRCTPCVFQECVLTPTGLCRSASAYVATQDYRRNASTSSEVNYFLAANTSYCAESDTTCAECLRAMGNGTRLSAFCVGKGGCVCVSICENVQWTMLAQAQLPTVMVSESESSSCSLVGASGSVSTLATPTPSRTPRKHMLAAEDRCTWYSNQTLCGLPRTCYDCLNTPIASGEVRVGRGVGEQSG